MFIPNWFESRPIKACIKTCKLDEIGTCEGWGALFQRVPLPITSRTDSKRVREMINSLTTHLKEETSEDVEHKVWCDTELTTNTRTIKEKTATVEKLHATVDELDASMNNLAMEVAELSAQLSRLRKEVFSATSMRHEETATNEKAIKDVEDAQSILTQAIHTLTDFYAKNSADPGLQRKSGWRYQCL